MKTTILITTVFVSLTNVAFADGVGERVEKRFDNRGDRIEQRLDRRGDRIDSRLDNRGERINDRLDRRADRAANNGHDRLANR